MRIAAVDDSAAERGWLLSALKEYAAMHGLELKTDAFAGGEELLGLFQPYAFSAVFLDIFMDGMTGVETARKLREQDDAVPIVFLTTSEEHRPDAFSVFATDYLIKPCVPEAVFRTMDHILRLRADGEPRLSFSFDRQDHSLLLSDIASLEADGNYLVITDQKGRRYRTRMTLREAESRLDGRFLRIIKGVVVNMDHVVQMTEAVCTMSAGGTLPMHSRNGRDVRQKWLNYKFARIRQG